MDPQAVSDRAVYSTQKGRLPEFHEVRDREIVSKRLILATRVQLSVMYNRPHGSSRLDDRKVRFEADNPNIGVSDALETAGSKRQRAATKANRAYVMLPTEVVLDDRLGAESLALFAYRATHIGNWSLQRRHINRVFAIGDRVFDRAIGQLQDAGYINRSRARDGTTRHGRIIETFQLPPVTTGYAFLMRTDITALPLKSVAALAYMCARPQGQHVYVRELCGRFGWRPMTARKWLRELIDGGFVQGTVRRDADGRLNGMTYAVLGNRGARTGTPRHAPPDDVFQDDGCQDDEKTPAYKDSSSTLHSTSTSNTLVTSACPSATAEGEEEDVTGEERRSACRNSGLLEWADQDQSTYGSAGQVWIDMLREVAVSIEGVAHDPRYLTERLNSASSGRIKQTLISPEGLADFHLLVETFAAINDYSPREALEELLHQIDRSIGTKPHAQLNSWHYLIILNLKYL